MTVAPDFASGTVDVPVPHAMSRMRSPGFGSMARAVARRHSAELPTLRTALVRSYPAAT